VARELPGILVLCAVCLCYTLHKSRVSLGDDTVYPDKVRLADSGGNLAHASREVMKPNKKGYRYSCVTVT
jgi:hypothetical protein